MELRRLRTGDEELLARAVAIFTTRPAQSSAFLTDPSARAVVAISSGQPIGWAWGHRLRRPDGRTMLLLYDLEVASDHRRQGVGRALVAEMKSLAIDLGCEEMWLVTEASNTAALATYTAGGGTWSAEPDRVVVFDLSG